MRFFDRKEEIAELRKNRELSTESSRFTVLTGRRRVGKTELLHEAFSDMPYIYFYVSRKALVDLCEDFRQIAEKALGRTIPGEIRRFSQIEMFDELRGIVVRDYDVFSGIALERYFAAKFVEERRYSRLGGWWNRKGEQEIDLVCENEFTNELAFYEVKRDKRRIDIALLNEKAQAFLEKNPSLRGHVQKSCGLSIDDM